MIYIAIAIVLVDVIGGFFLGKYLKRKHMETSIKLIDEITDRIAIIDTISDSTIYKDMETCRMNEGLEYYALYSILNDIMEKRRKND